MAFMATDPLDSQFMLDAINEFYTTDNEQRRNEINYVLCRFKKEYDCVQTVGACMRMINLPTNSQNVRYFGIVSLYDVIRFRSEECIANQTLQMSLKTFLIDSLTSGAYAQATLIVNKLSAALALFSLYCVPDLWTTPVEDLTRVLAGTPEILLKVLSDMAAEFQNISISLPQRSILKGELHKFSTSIIQVLAVVLRGGDTSSITKQAAVECVEQWLKLPGICLDQWTHVISDVLGEVVEDCTALASILDIIAENDEFHRFTTLIIGICQYMYIHVSKKIEDEATEDATSEEIASLVTATCCVAEKSVPTLVECAVQAGNTEIIIQLAQLMQLISNIQGQFPQQEMISDLPSPFFITLRGEIIQTSCKTKIDPGFLSSIACIYAQVLGVSIQKLKFPPVEQWLTWNLEDREKFIEYRTTRSEVSTDSYYFAAADTLNHLNEKLEEALTAGDVNGSEVCLFEWECVADSISECDYTHILRCLELCRTPHLSLPPSGSIDLDMDRRGASLLRLLYGLSHLIQTSEKAIELECSLIPVILTYVSPRFPNVRQALSTLQKFSEDKGDCLDIVGDQISTTCYELFNNHSVRDNERLAALKCIGYVLFRKSPSETMKIIGSILSQQNINEPGIDDETRYQRYSFQINIFSVLFTSLSVRNESTTEKSSKHSDEEPAILQLLREAIPVFEALCSGESGLDQNKSGSLIHEVCKAVRAALTSLPEQHLSSFFPFVASLLKSALFIPGSFFSACQLAKSTVLQCQSLVGVEMADAFAQWVQCFEQHVNSPQIDEYLQLVYSVVKKNWKMIRKFPGPSLAAFRSAIKICLHITINSSVPPEVRCASQILSSFAVYTLSNSDIEMKEIFAEQGPTLLQAVFGRVQKELVKSTVESLSDVLYFYFREFTTDTRVFLNTEPYGNSPHITAMFREIGNARFFRQQLIRFNMSSIQNPNPT